ncbi:LysM peptidoglycan-binding domain-containing protein [Luteolibacter pohnpeiensis]|uniref:LysM peptidoglycan-binding domain-containing protein n=1 Tax=Luteolibacter pohnpeiensis TaxID=454153 RepID=A0A934S845_9BACT|nr:LysM domain-containing protein [Luteolibacter pohnpeiensis]MBK1883922.1 LysM peptidoglycan-binding domain-containing protein [Luteolibacter pohnpeiensis]
MRFSFFIKLVAFLAVLGVMVVTGMLVYHVMIKPLPMMSKWVPNPTEIIGGQKDADFASMLDSAELPDIDPGEKAFQKAHSLLAMGHLEEAREKLNTIINVFPTSSAAPTARRIVGDMNLDEVLSTAHMEGKETYVVKRGDSYNLIANKNQTSLEMIVYLNGLLELGSLQPGDELIIMPLNFRLMIEPERKAISLWDGGKFLRDYLILDYVIPGKLASKKCKITSEAGYVDGRAVRQESDKYRGSEKMIQIDKDTIQIRPFHETTEIRPRGIYISPTDLEELTLLTRPGNEVEIRHSTR